MKLLFAIDEDIYDQFFEIDDDLLLLQIPAEAKMDGTWKGIVQLKRPDGHFQEVEASFYPPHIDPPPLQIRNACILAKISLSDIEIGTTVWLLD